MRPLGFRTRLLVILLLFAMVPTVVLTLAWGGAVGRALPLLGGGAPWDSVAATGQRALAAARASRPTPAQERALREHEQELASSLEQARRLRYIAGRTVPIVVGLALVGALALLWIASRVAGHLSRQLSRPLDELVAWTGRIARGEPLPESAARRGAPEFEVLRSGMRRMAVELEAGRTQALEAERLEAFRESARRVAHELKNPLTPIRFAVQRLARDASPAQAETVEVLTAETERLERMARDFAQFGRLPDSPPSIVDVPELVSYVARSTVPDRVRLAVDVPASLPQVTGQYEALSRALSNLLINAVEACGGREEAAVTVRARPSRLDGVDAVRLEVQDNGCGVPAEKLPGIWDPYVTNKPAGTGLGLAIVAQTVRAHGGEVHASSRPDEGMTIGFTIPVAPAGGDAHGPGNDPPVTAGTQGGTG